uniref:Putative secreted protein n=1 Tax=Rhipicephalus microplus TaxID=6941 RepID=A0A6G5A317_RHIMP
MCHSQGMTITVILLACCHTKTNQAKKHNFKGSFLVETIIMRTKFNVNELVNINATVLFNIGKEKCHFKISTMSLALLSTDKRNENL